MTIRKIKHYKWDLKEKRTVQNYSIIPIWLHSSKKLHASSTLLFSKRIFTARSTIPLWKCLFFSSLKFLVDFIEGFNLREMLILNILYYLHFIIKKEGIFKIIPSFQLSYFTSRKNLKPFFFFKFIYAFPCHTLYKMAEIDSFEFVRVFLLYPLARHYQKIESTKTAYSFPYLKFFWSL